MQRVSDGVGRADLRALISRAAGGDLAAFTELVERYQEMAFGYAFSILGDFHLAQDAAQQAFIAGYSDLGRLEEPEKFPSWLRGIVRHQCWRLLRQRRRQVPTVPLDDAAGLATAAPGPDRQVEEGDAIDRVLAAIDALPRPQREVTILFYIKEYSQREIAAFLELPVTTVNNRLHAARKRLKGGMLPMAKDILEQNGLPDDFAARVGRIVEARGPVVDVRFAPERLPTILNALTVGGTAGQAAIALTVAQHLPGGVVRCIAPVASPGPRVELAAGTEVTDTAGPIEAPIGPEAVRDALARLGGATGPPRILETGVKALDLLCPVAVGGTVGLFGDLGAGKLVLVMELAHNLAAVRGDLGIVTFVHAEAEVALVQPLIGDEPGMRQALYIPVADAGDLVSSPAVAPLDARVYFSRDLALEGLYPAVDPLRSTSRFLDPALVGPEHVAVASGVQHLLLRHQAIASRSTGPGAEERSDEERAIVARARRVRRFLTQPFFVAEEFTERPGQLVSRQETVAAFAALLRGEYDDLPEDAFSMCGTLDQVVEQARAMGG